MLSTEDLTNWGKLMSKYIGPFNVTSVTPDKTVELELPPSMKAKHNRFNISKVKMFYPNDDEDFPERKQLDRPPPVSVDGDDVFYNVECILGKRRTRVGRTRRFVVEYLVKWQGYGITEASWQSEGDLQEPEVLEEIVKFERLQLEADEQEEG
jgi:Chromo (CHRromatin Organisation MOdifier) domain